MHTNLVLLEAAQILSISMSIWWHQAFLSSFAMKVHCPNERYNKGTQKEKGTKREKIPQRGNEVNGKCSFA